MNPLRIKITFGGSHRSNARCIAKLKPLLDPHSSFLPVSLGSKRIMATAYDTPELRAMLKQCGGSVCRQQPSWLNENRE